MSLELSFINREGELSDIENLPTKETYGNLGHSPISQVSYNLRPSDGIPCSEITAINRDNLKTRLIELAKEFPSLLKNKHLSLSSFAWNSLYFCQQYVGQIKYKEVENKSN